MALIVTPGAANADSYASLTEATAYFTARGVAAWTGADAIKENALRVATTYLDNQYRNRWVGYRAEQAQALAWPRIGTGGDRFRFAGDGFAVYGIIDSDGFEIDATTVPTQIKNACLEAALLVASGQTLEPNLERGGQIKSISKGVGPLNKSVTYMDGASSVDRYTVIEGLLRGLVKSTPGSSSGNVSLVRS